jgi:hypothetical protein
MKRKIDRYQQALSKRVNAALELNKLAFVTILMQASFLAPGLNGGVVYPQEMVPVEQVIQRVADGWHIVTRQVKESKNG